MSLVVVIVHPTQFLLDFPFCYSKEIIHFGDLNFQTRVVYPNEVYCPSISCVFILNDDESSVVSGEKQ